jgi:two-component system response regulator
MIKMSQSSADAPIDILLVEDNPTDAALTLHALQEHPDARIYHVADGEQALDFLFGHNAYAQRPIHHRPRLILLDLELPKLSGLDVLSILKADDQTKAIPIVMFTSSNAHQSIITSYHLGINSYVIKPVDFTEFVESVQTVSRYWLNLNQGRPATSPAL